MPDREAPDVSILGGGVIGITSALYLELAGYTTALYAARLPFEDDHHPAFVTPYAAASVQPASVTMDDLSHVFETSQRFFSLLADAGSMGVRRQPHFVLYDDDRPDPEYAPAVERFRRLSELDAPLPRPDDRSVFGWRFRAYFAEMPVYVRRCYALYRALGGTVHETTLTREQFLDLPGDALLNCAGLGAWDLFDDPRPAEIHVGHQVVARDLPVARTPRGDVFSYKYIPETSRSDTTGEVYAYPRMDATVLGGSRLRTDLTTERDWGGEIPGETVTIDGVAVPARIVELNGEILERYADVDLRAADLSARYGYRPVRDPDGAGVRVERETVGGRTVVHNYGHGGAGVTLSWGSAAKAADRVRELREPDPEPLDVPSEFAVADRLASLV